jgi:hypothetical protein
VKQGSEKLDKAGYRKFGLTTGAIVAALFGVLLPWLFSFAYALWPWVFGAVLVVWALLAPRTLQPVHAGWMKFAQVMNWINTRVILSLLFYGIFTPLGMTMRLLGRDPMQRRLDKTLPTYRVKSHNDAKDNVERPF